MPHLVLTPQNSYAGEEKHNRQWSLLKLCFDEYYFWPTPAPPLSIVHSIDLLYIAAWHDRRDVKDVEISVCPLVP